MHTQTAAVFVARSMSKYSLRVQKKNWNRTIGADAKLHAIWCPYLITKGVPTQKEPYILRDPDNFIPANPLVTTVHIQPEWYFLFAYAILRSIPNKLGGVIALVMSIAILLIIPTKKIKVPRNTILPNQPSTIQNNNKHSNSTNMNRSPTSRRPIYPNRTNPNNTILHILHSKTNNNKVWFKGTNVVKKSAASHRPGIRWS